MMNRTADSCLRCQTPLVEGAPYCHSCGIARTAAATGEYPTYDFERFFTYAVDMLCIAGIDGYFKLVNPAFERILGYTATELQAQPFVEFIHPEDRSETVSEVGKLATGEPTLSFENRYRCKDGTYRHLQWACYPETATGLLYAIARDVTEWRQGLDRVDPLTGLASDTEFAGRLHQEWNRARRLRVSLALAIVDLDQLKHFNERYGYVAGDHCLARIGALLRSRMRRVGDFPARIGGQRLGLVLSGSTDTQAAELCEAVRQDVVALGIPHEGVAPPGLLTIRAGVAAMIPDQAHSDHDLLAAAEGALAEAKRRGPNTVVRA